MIQTQNIMLMNNFVAQNELLNNQFKVLDAVLGMKKDNWSQWWSTELAVDFSSMGQVITVADNVVTVPSLATCILYIVHTDADSAEPFGAEPQ